MADRRTAWLALALLAMPLTGCVNVVGAETVTTTTTSTTPQVQRPRVLDMAGVDPCVLLSREQQAAFGIDSSPGPDDSAVFEAKACYFWNHKGFESVSFIPVPHMGVDRFSAGRVKADVRDLDVSGFPAKENIVRVQLPNYPPSCDVVVDVAPGQVLNVHYAELSRGGKPPQLSREYICRRAHAAAEAAISTLMTTR
ncbi:DUF3558 domain-containing protein [Allokutzneria sp. NRRL B-24872]|uniref:DUF3558 domain-containing protein n=1 Tax=Allokutzneria sp. NRRL B-24872 TaxID=1137961 RepID=UPI001177C81E|nr:DUF3558 domain-containing protein [Allokutzneria sp. NRRL B-24872]